MAVLPHGDVHPKPVAVSRERTPCLGIVQRDLLDGLPTRRVAPLFRSAMDQGWPPARGTDIPSMPSMPSTP